MTEDKPSSSIELAGLASNHALGSPDQRLEMTATEWEQEERAFFLLQWVPYSLPVEFDEDLALKRHYTKLWRQRSDAALDELQKAEERQARKAQRSTTNHQILPCDFQENHATNPANSGTNTWPKGGTPSLTHTKTDQGPKHKATIRHGNNSERTSSR